MTYNQEEIRRIIEMRSEFDKITQSFVDGFKTHKFSSHQEYIEIYKKKMTNLNQEMKYLENKILDESNLKLAESLAKIQDYNACDVKKLYDFLKDKTTFPIAEELIKGIEKNSSTILEFFNYSKQSFLERDFSFEFSVAVPKTMHSNSKYSEFIKNDQVMNINNIAAIISTVRNHASLKKYLDITPKKGLSSSETRDVLGEKVHTEISSASTYEKKGMDKIEFQKIKRVLTSIDTSDYEGINALFNFIKLRAGLSDSTEDMLNTVLIKSRDVVSFNNLRIEFNKNSLIDLIGTGDCLSLGGRYMDTGKDMIKDKDVDFLCLNAYYNDKLSNTLARVPLMITKNNEIYADGFIGTKFMMAIPPSNRETIFMAMYASLVEIANRNKLKKLHFNLINNANHQGSAEFVHTLKKYTYFYKNNNSIDLDIKIEATGSFPKLTKAVFKDIEFLEKNIEKKKFRKKILIEGFFEYNKKEYIKSIQACHDSDVELMDLNSHIDKELKKQKFQLSYGSGTAIVSTIDTDFKEYHLANLKYYRDKLIRDNPEGKHFPSIYYDIYAYF